MISHTSKSALAALVAISLILLSVFIFGVYDIRTNNRETIELLSAADEASEMRTNAQFIRMMRNNLAGDIRAFEEIVLTSSKLVSLIETIESTGRALGLELEIVSVNEMQDRRARGPKTIRIELEAKGSWASASSFVRAMESLPHRVIMEEVNLSKEDTVWHLRMAISIFSFDE